MQPTGNVIIQRVTLAVGAGIYEEFLFDNVNFNIYKIDNFYFWNGSILAE